MSSPLPYATLGPRWASKFPTEGNQGERRQMKLNAPVTGTGYFWPPDRPSERLPGNFTISTSGDIRLEVSAMNKFAAGVLVLPNDKKPFGVYEVTRGARDWPLLTGEFDLTKRVIFEDCRAIGGSTSFAPNISSRITYHARRCCIGASYDENVDPETPLTVTSISAGVDGLIGWLTDAIRWKEDYELGSPKIAFRTRLPEPIQVEVGDWRIKVQATRTGVSRRIEKGHAVKIGQSAVVVIERVAEAPLDDFLRQLRVFQELLCFGLGARCCVESITALAETESDQEAYLNVFYQDGIRPSDTQAPKDSPSLHALFMAREEAVNSPEDVIRAWFALYESAPSALQRLRASAVGQDHLENLLLLVVQALEELHRAKNGPQPVMTEDEFQEIVNATTDVVPDRHRGWWTNTMGPYLLKPPLRKRLLDHARENLSEVMTSGQIKKLVHELVSARNPISHGAGGYGDPDVSLHRLWKQGEALLKLCVLDEIGVDKALVLERSRELRHWLRLDGWRSIEWDRYEI